ncbi:MAG: hypothetical protein U1E16_09360 [Hyphomicrobiales bacterium]
MIPKWLLRRFDLFHRTVTLPNGFDLPYRSNTIPCCSECNAALGVKIEEPVKDLLTGGFERFHGRLNDALPLLFRWLCLLVFKTHYRDQQMRMSPDRRMGDERIGSLYQWDEFHHLHTVARSALTGCRISEKILGSLFVVQFEANEYDERFDYADLYPSQTVLVRVDDVAIIAALNDSGGALNGLGTMIKKIAGNLSGLQIRELLAHLSSSNIHMKQRPKYSTYFNPFDHSFEIRAELPDTLEWEPLDRQILGKLMLQCCGPVVSRGAPSEDAKLKVLSDLSTGRLTFLFNEDGSFNGQSVVKQDIA